jgi:hypothetical protein
MDKFESNKFKRLQMKQLIDQLPDDIVDDALKTMTELSERADYVVYFNGIPLMNPNNKLHMQRLNDMASGLTPPEPEKRPELTVIDTKKETH